MRQIFGKDLPRARSQAIDVLERRQRQALGDVRAAAVDHVPNRAHARRHRWRGDDPSAAQSREAVGLGQAAGRHEYLAKRGGGSRQRRFVVLRFRVDLVDEHPRADRFGHHPDLFERVSTCHRAARIVRVRNHDQLRRGRQRRANDIRIEGEAFRPAALEMHDVRAGGARRGDQRIVRRCLDQHVVARFEQREHRLEIRSRCAGGDRDSTLRTFGNGRRSPRRSGTKPSSAGPEISNASAAVTSPSNSRVVTGMRPLDARS